MRSLIFNLNFYNALGGYLVIISLINLYRGYYITDLVAYVSLTPMVLLAFYMIFHLGELKLSRPMWSNSVLAFMLFLSWILFSGLLHQDSQNFRALMLYMIVFSVIPYITGLFISGKLYCIDYRWSIFVFLVLLLLSSCSTFTYWHEIIFMRYRITGYAVVGKNVVGLVLGIYGFVFAYYIYAFSSSNILRVLVVLLLLLVVINMFFSGSMGNFLSLCFTIILFVGLRSRLPVLKLIVLTILVSAIVILSYHWFLKKIYWQWQQPIGTENIGKYISTVQKIRDGEYCDIGGQRIYFINKYIDQFSNNPLTGSGFGSRECIRCDPHNFLIELIGEIGLIGLLLFIPIIFCALKSSYHIIRSPSSSPLLLFLAAMLFSHVFEALVSGSIFINNILWFLIGVMPHSSHLAHNIRCRGIVWK